MINVKVHIMMMIRMIRYIKKCIYYQSYIILYIKSFIIHKYRISKKFINYFNKRGQYGNFYNFIICTVITVLFI